MHLLVHCLQKRTTLTYDCITLCSFILLIKFIKNDYICMLIYHTLSCSALFSTKKSNFLSLILKNFLCNEKMPRFTQSNNVCFIKSLLRCLHLKNFLRENIYKSLRICMLILLYSSQRIVYTLYIHAHIYIYRYTTYIINVILHIILLYCKVVIFILHIIICCGFVLFF